VTETSEITCPRCGRSVTVAFYGPCDDCCGELRAAYAGVARTIEVARFEPKMNVVPNQVATKD
jgi:NMD protein affecting ribosome stability and mRNA decay